MDVLLDYVEDGQPLDVFLAEYPGVTRELVVAALEEVKALLAETGEATVVRPD